MYKKSILMRFSIFCGFFLFFTPILIFSQENFGVQIEKPQNFFSVSPQDALLNGYESFKNEDWVSAAFFLKKASSLPANATEELRYMLIASEIRAAQYEDAEQDCAQFLRDFPKSDYFSLINYWHGFSLHKIAENERAVLVLSDFCHQNPQSDLYSSALFWIAESFYDEYNYDSARALYERIVMEFANCEKSTDARMKIEAIDRRKREEKLLYLLKTTGEEYLSAKEDFERRLKTYKAEDSAALKKQLADSQRKIDELVDRLAAHGDFLPEDFNETENSDENQGLQVLDREVETLKRKARALQIYLDENPETRENQ